MIKDAASLATVPCMLKVGDWMNAYDLEWSYLQGTGYHFQSIFFEIYLPAIDFTTRLPPFQPSLFQMQKGNIVSLDQTTAVIPGGGLPTSLVDIWLTSGAHRYSVP